jgi:exonuclease III
MLNLNLWLLPPPFSAENKKRLKRFVKLVERLKPDVITLQEVWLNRYVDYLKIKLKDYFVFATRKGFLNKSGLVTLTRIKPTSSRIGFFGITKNHSIRERFARKGCHVIKIPIGKKIVSIINTHLYTPIKKADKKITMKQFEFLKKISSKCNAIIQGDLNLKLNEVLKLNKGHFLCDSKKDITFSKKNKYHNSRINMFLEDSSARIDHVLSRILPKKKMTFRSKVIKSPLLSDHFAVFAMVEV